jgi:uncharacterized protein YbjQ (UPF0145 family)/DNA-directed RNA polymerase subunit RPC12/RpoP
MPEDALVNFDCPHCSQSLEADEQMRGTEITCPQCQNTIQIPVSCPVEPPPQIEVKPAPRAIDLASSPRERQLFIITTTGNEVSGQQIEMYLGIARGIVVRSPSGSESLFGGLKQIIGGNIETYAKLCDQARQDAFTRMIEHANNMKADAIIAFRYDATEFSPGVTEVLAYGTAVRLSKCKS